MPGKPIRCEIAEPAHDADDDRVVYHYQWKKNQLPQLQLGDDATEVPGTWVRAHEQWTCSATASDATLGGGTSASGVSQQVVVFDE